MVLEEVAGAEVEVFVVAEVQVDLPLTAFALIVV